jgi:hypothetical protein
LSGLFGDPTYHDTPYASGFIMKTIASCDGLVDALSWWTFSDVFEEQGQVFSRFRFIVVYAIFCLVPLLFAVVEFMLFYFHDGIRSAD